MGRILPSPAPSTAPKVCVFQISRAVHGAVLELQISKISEPGQGIFPCAAAPEIQSKENPGGTDDDDDDDVLHFSSHHKFQPEFMEQGTKKEIQGGFFFRQLQERSSSVRRQLRRTSRSGLWDPGQQHQMLAVDAELCCEMVQKTPPSSLGS